MAGDNSEVLDVAKENIQPLRHGRKAAQLKTALQAQADPDVYQLLMKQREKFEYIIRMYEGDDPLDPYYNYILWLEQSFPSAGRENNVPLLLEDTLLKFKDCEKYRQDPRLAQLIVKYIGIQPNSLELYQLVYNLGLGTMCTSLYKGWAEELQKARDFKRADQVFQLGLQCRAQPVQELQDAHVQFQLSIARKLLEENVNPLAASSETKESSRGVLSKLQPSKVKSSRVSKDSAGIFSSSKGSQNMKSSNFGSSKFQVYQEDTNDDQLKMQHKSETEVLPRGSTANRENLMGASKWCGQKAKQLASKKSFSNPTPTFDIHEDPEAACHNLKTVIRPCALKTRKEEFRCPVAIFGPPNPSQLPMYPKQLVYVGGRDVQLEEIRAAYYWKKIEKQKQIDAMQIPSNFENEHLCDTSSLHQASAWNLSTENQSCDERSREKVPSNQFPNSDPVHDANCDYRTVRKSERYTKLFQSNDSLPMNGCDMLITPARPVAPIDVYLDEYNSCTRDFDNRPDLEYKKIGPTAPASRKSVLSREDTSFSSKSTTKLELMPEMNADSMNNDFKFLRPNLPSNKTKSIDDDCFSNRGLCGKQFDDFDFTNSSGNVSGPHCRKSMGVFNFGNVEGENVNFNHSLSTSMTINTKAAMNVIQQMWESPLSRPDPLDTFETVDKKLPAQSNKCLFPIYCEDDSPAAPRNEPSTSNKISFDVFCDDTFSQSNEKYLTKSSHQAGPLPSKSRPDVSKSSILKKSCETERKFGTPLPLIVPVKLQDSPIKPENKENRFPDEYLSPENDENNHEESHEEEHFDTGRDCEIDDDTCNTRVFAVTLPSSTPRTLKEKSRTSRKSVYEESYLSHDDDFSICYTKSAPKLNMLHNTSEGHKRCNKTGSDLSLILENSKEQGSGSSSSSSCNTGSKLYSS